MSDLKDMEVKDICKLPGVADLKLSARLKFAKALKSEANGNHAEAELFLNEAIAAESAS